VDVLESKQDALRLKQDALLGALREMRTVIVAYSGGADSAYLAWAAREALGDRAVAIARKPLEATVRTTCRQYLASTQR
jgi:PP-loop superfamily ATP-utilizing enzyme